MDSSSWIALVSAVLGGTSLFASIATLNSLGPVAQQRARIQAGLNLLREMKELLPEGELKPPLTPPPASGSATITLPTTYGGAYEDVASAVAIEASTYAGAQFASQESRENLFVARAFMVMLILFTALMWLLLIAGAATDTMWKVGIGGLVYLVILGFTPKIYRKFYH
jgi:hypothetical protein